MVGGLEGRRNRAAEGAGEDKGERGREEEEEEDEEEEAIGACEDRRRANYQLAYTDARTPTYPCPERVAGGWREVFKGRQSAESRACARARAYTSYAGGGSPRGSTRET